MAEQLARVLCLRAIGCQVTIKQRRVRHSLAEFTSDRIVSGIRRGDQEAEHQGRERCHKTRGEFDNIY
jgi:hypothetical protein